MLLPHLRAQNDWRRKILLVRKHITQGSLVSTEGYREFSHMKEELEQSLLEKVGVLQSVCTRGAGE